jgi:GNAT superfamily N-acetyltransferase
MKPIIRLITEADFRAAEHILQVAFAIKESRLDDIRRYYALQSESYFLALIDGEPAGMAGAIHYGSFAFVGMMAVDPQFQHQGLGYALMERLLARIEEWKVPVISLDASAVGARLYPRFGFKDFDKVISLQLIRLRPVCSMPKEVRALGLKDLDTLIGFDRPIFGGDRGPVLKILLHDFPGRAFGVYSKSGQLKGYLFAQSARLGPWVALDPDDAELLFRAALSLAPDYHPSVILPEVNAAGTKLLERFGYEMKLINRHMYRGCLPLPSQRSFFYGQTSFGLG